MASHYLLDYTARRLLSVDSTDMGVGMHSAFKDKTFQRFYFEREGLASFIYIIDGKGNKQYLTVQDSGITSDVGMRTRYSVVLANKQSTTATAAETQKQQMQLWVLSFNSSYSGGYFHLYPNVIIRSYLQFEMLTGNNKRENHYALIYFDGNIVSLRNIDALNEDEKKLHCTFMLDNRQFVLESQKQNKQLILNAGKQSNSNTYIPSAISNLNNANPFFWRIEAANTLYHTWGGVYYISLPDPLLGNNGWVDHWLHCKGNSLSIQAADQVTKANEQANAQWEFVEIYDTGHCQIKNVATGNFLAINAADDNLCVESVYDNSFGNENTPENLRKRWIAKSANTPPTN